MLHTNPAHGLDRSPFYFSPACPVSIIVVVVVVHNPSTVLQKGYLNGSSCQRQIPPSHFAPCLSKCQRRKKKTPEYQVFDRRPPSPCHDMPMQCNDHPIIMLDEQTPSQGRPLAGLAQAKQNTPSPHLFCRLQWVDNTKSEEKKRKGRSCSRRLYARTSVPRIYAFAVSKGKSPLAKQHPCHDEVQDEKSTSQSRLSEC